jgi:hypothetical protein
MRLNVIILTIVFATAVAFISFASSQPATGNGRIVHVASSTEKRPDVTEESLKKCIAKTAKEIVEHFKLNTAKWSWIDEPPGIVRGVRYPVDNVVFKLYIAQGERLFRRFDENRKWNYEEFLGCNIGGIQYDSGEIRLDIGAAVPFQFRRQPKDGK